MLSAISDESPKPQKRTFDDFQEDQDSLTPIIYHKEYEKQHPNPEDQAKSIMEEVVESIFTPGVNARVQSVIHGVFLFLLLNLFALFWLSGFNFHVGFLIAIATCLWASVTWFIANMPPQQVESLFGDLVKKNQ